MRHLLLLAFIFALALPIGKAKAESFFASDAYWNGKTAFEKGDYETALKLWKKPADEGVGEAQYFIGALYHGGMGVEKDFKKAMDWYQKAAKQGVASAQMGIGSLYGDGLGVEKDYIKARMWFSISAHNGSERAEMNLKKVAARMTEEEIKKAEAMAMDWVKANEK